MVVHVHELLKLASCNKAYLAAFCPQGRAPGPAHVPMSADEAEREAMMARMKAAGLGGQMYNRDDIMSQVGWVVLNLPAFR